MRKKKLTVIMVPEAHETVRRIHTSRRMIHGIAIFIVISAFLFAAWLGWTKRAYDGTVDSLAKKLTEERRSHHDEIHAKEETIERLQNEVVLLTEQTNEVREKLASLVELEKEIRSISGVTLSDTEEEESPVQAAGGSLQPVDVSEILYLADTTEVSLQELSDSLTVMSHRLDALIDELEHLEYIASITPSIWPAEGGRRTSGYGYRIDPFTRRSTFHSGIDIDGRTGDQIYAAANGVVSETGTANDLGNYVIIDHSRGIKTLYAHLSRILVEEKQNVDKGELIALMGSTGRSTGPHLHYEVHKDGSPVDPSPYIPD